MEINRHIAFPAKEEPALIRYLDKNRITYDPGEIVAFDIAESDPHWAFIGRYARRKKLICYTETLFSEEERQAAEWMELRSIWHYAYPQPEEDFRYETITYTRNNHCRECGRGLEQIAPFRIKKPPKWSKRHFLMLNWVSDELFTDEIAKTVLTQMFPELSFREVTDKKGATAFPNIFQLQLPILAEEGIVEKQHCLRSICVCHRCKGRKYHLNGEGMLQMHRSVFHNAPDIVKTAEWFGWGYGAYHKIIISQKMYQCLVSHRLNQNLEFSPIDLVD